MDQKSIVNIQSACSWEDLTGIHSPSNSTHLTWPDNDDLAMHTTHTVQTYRLPYY
jgi:hypothetical protein